MKNIEAELLEGWYSLNYQKKLKGRYIILSDISSLLSNLPLDFKVNKIGESFLKNDIHSVTFGKGRKRILVWTQMHGNESTGTKALFDLFNFFNPNNGESEVVNRILKECTIVCIPILNPDGAIAYTRVTSQDVDLNRDVIKKDAIESCILQEILRKTKPHYCFNMHDQRTIFSVGEENNPATISFLAPSVDKKRTLTDGRKQTMEVIVSMNNLLQKFIPNQIGRYTDEFYPTATGDNFQKMGHNTILVESGHFKNDYQREKTRKYTFFALLEGLNHIAFREKASNYEDYFKIPNNEKLYLDVILVDVIYEKNKIDIGILFEEILKDKQLHFIPKVKIKGDLSNYNANRIVNDLSFPNENKLKKWLKNEFN